MSSIERRTALGHLRQPLAGFELRALFGRQLFARADEGLEPHTVDERQGAAE